MHQPISKIDLKDIYVFVLLCILRGKRERGLNALHNKADRTVSFLPISLLVCLSVSDCKTLSTDNLTRPSTV